MDVMSLLALNVDVDACSGTVVELTTSSGTIQSPGYDTSTYPDNAYCQWLITAPAGNVRMQRQLYANSYFDKCLGGFLSTVLSVEPLVHCVVCLSSVCDVLYCGETVRPSEKLSEGVNRKPRSKC